MEIRMPRSKHTSTIIFLHGRGSFAAEFASELFESQASSDQTLLDLHPGMKWVFPTAPKLDAARFNGVKLSQWFDMWSTECPQEQEEQQDFAPQVARISHIIEEEALIIGYENVFLAGISQGCAVALHALLSQQHRLAGLVGLSGWTAKEDDLRRKAAPSAISTPIFMGHGEDDMRISFAQGEHLRDVLRSLGMQVEWHGYETGGHWLNEPQGVDDLSLFIQRKSAPRDCATS